MIHYSAKDLADSFRTVRKNTLIIAEEIPENQYGYRAAPNTRTVAQMLVHLGGATRMSQQIHAVERRTTLEGFDFPGWIQRMEAEEKASRTKAQIVGLLREDGEKFASWLEGLSDEFLGERVALLPGMT